MAYIVFYRIGLRDFFRISAVGCVPPSLPIWHVNEIDIVFIFLKKDFIAQIGVHGHI